MADFKMPFGAEFSPEKIDIIKLLKIMLKNILKNQIRKMLKLDIMLHV